MHQLMPQHASDLLRQAAATPITRADPLARVKAIEAATERIRNLYPWLFKTEEDEDDNQRS